MTGIGKVVLVLTLLVAGLVLGCAEDDFSGSCSLCVNGTPVGPSESEEQCRLWGEEFGCIETILTNAGMCGDISATCSVSACETAVEPCVVGQ